MLQFSHFCKKKFSAVNIIEIFMAVRTFNDILKAHQVIRRSINVLNNSLNSGFSNNPRFAVNDTKSRVYSSSRTGIEVNGNKSH